jgi:hypothetical protein
MLPFDPTSSAHKDLIRLVSQYRAASWFAGEGGSDQEIAERARTAWWAEWESEVDTDGTDDGIFISTADPERAIWFDPEADTCEENHTYTEVLGQLVSLTGGELSVSNIAEDWQREPGHVFVSCRVNGIVNELEFRENDDWVDPAVISQLNAAIPEGGRRFFVFDGGGQAFCITWASRAEAEQLAGHGHAVLLDRAPDAWEGVD